MPVNLLLKLVMYFVLVSFFVCVGLAQDPVQITVNSEKTIGEMTPLWSYFGYDEPNTTYSVDGLKLLDELAAMSPAPVYIRTHNLLTTKDGTPDLKWGFTNAYTEDQQGNPIYDWTIVDQILDAFVERDMRPIMELGFMPKALSTNPEPYAHSWSEKGPLWTGWTYPPKDYDKWAQLIYELTKHTIERYGRETVDTWLWQVWNEPDIPYWAGTFEEYCKLYDYAVSAVKRACATCTVGGPHTTNPNNEGGYQYLYDFLDHCVNGTNYATGEKGSPLEYISFHAKGSPTLVDGHIRMDMSPQLDALASGFKAINSFPSLKNVPVIIGEFDPEGCAACSETREPKYAYRNGTVYPSYMASSLAKCYELKDEYGVNLVGALSWAFAFLGQEHFAGFRDLATNGIDKPVLNVFRMMGMMTGQRIAAQSERGISASQVIENSIGEDAEIGVIASKDQNTIAVMVWNYHDDDLLAESPQIALTINGIDQEKVLMQHFRVDQEFSNSFEKWKSIGSPAEMTETQYQQVEQAGQLQLYTSPEWLDISENKKTITFTLPRQGVSLIRLSW